MVDHYRRAMKLFDAQCHEPPRSFHRRAKGIKAMPGRSGLRRCFRQEGNKTFMKFTSRGHHPLKTLRADIDYGFAMKATSTNLTSASASRLTLQAFPRRSPEER